MCEFSLAHVYKQLPAIEIAIQEQLKNSRVC